MVSDWIHIHCIGPKQVKSNLNWNAFCTMPNCVCCYITHAECLSNWRSDSTTPLRYSNDHVNWFSHAKSAPVVCIYVCFVSMLHHAFSCWTMFHYASAGVIMFHHEVQQLKLLSERVICNLWTQLAAGAVMQKHSCALIFAAHGVAALRIIEHRRADATEAVCRKKNSLPLCYSISETTIIPKQNELKFSAMPTCYSCTGVDLTHCGNCAHHSHHACLPHLLDASVPGQGTQWDQVGTVLFITIGHWVCTVHGAV